MKLTDLEPKFLRYEVREEAWRRQTDACRTLPPGHEHTDACSEVVIGPRVYLPWANALADAQGVKFLCPKCFAANGGPVGTHAVICWSRSSGIPDDAEPSGRWTLDGTGYGDLTLNGDPPGNARSVLLIGGCEWHGFITDGEVT